MDDEVSRHAAKQIAARLLGANEGQSIYTFHRPIDGREFFYPIVLDDDDQARRNAECNPGTLKVVNEMTERVVWPIQETLH